MWLELHKLLTASHRKQICLRKWMVCGNPFPAPKNIVWLYILLPTASAPITLQMRTKVSTTNTCRPHSWHSGDIPESALYLPAGHDVQLAVSEEVDPSVPYVPAAHTKPEHVEAPVICTRIYTMICTHIYTNIHTYFYIHILCIVPHRRILCMIFVVAQTQTHSTYTLSTPAVAWYLPALASSRELQVWHTSSSCISLQKLITF